MALGSAHMKDSLQDFLQAQTLGGENAKDSTYYIGELYFHIHSLFGLISCSSLIDYR